MRLLMKALRQAEPVPAALQVEVPWEPVLTEEETLRGMTYYGSGTRLRRLVHKLLAGDSIKVVTLGGSVTCAAQLHRQQKSYSALLFKLINSTFPHR